MPTRIDQLSLVESEERGEGPGDAAAGRPTPSSETAPGRPDSPSSSSLWCAGSKEDVLDKISYFAMGFVLAGLVFAAIGFLYPRDLQRDPAAPARDNETVDLEFMKLTDALNAIIISGMVLLAIGGLILSAIFMNSVVCQDCQRDSNRATSSRSMTSQRTSPGKAIGREQNYGAFHFDDSPR